MPRDIPLPSQSEPAKVDLDATEGRGAPARSDQTTDDERSEAATVTREGMGPTAGWVSAAIDELFGPRSDTVRRYVALLGSTGITHGLLGPREAERLWERHVLNCAALHLGIGQDLCVIDVGSGAGLPGLVLAIARPDLRVTLVEPLARRVAWLDAARVELDLPNVTVRRARAEALRGQLAAPVVTARAVAPLARLASWCLPLVAPDGVLLAVKGSTASSEAQRDSAAIAATGGRVARIVEYGGSVLPTPTTVVEIRASAPHRPPSTVRPRGRKRPRR